VGRENAAVRHRPNRAALISAVDEAIEALDQPLREIDQRDGWREVDRTRLLAAFRELRAACKDATPLTEQVPPPMLVTRPSLARDLDDTPIEGGPLLDLVVRAHVLLLRESGAWGWRDSSP
jgi:hypothetical protein